MIADSTGAPLEVGDVVNIIRGRYQGASGTIRAITMSGLIKVRTGSMNDRLVNPAFVVKQSGA